MDSVSKASNLGFTLLTEGVNFDAAIQHACAMNQISRGSKEFLAVRYRMARDLYEW